VKAIRRSLIGLIVGLLGAVGWNYIQTFRRNANVIRRTASILGSELARSADSIEYTENEKGVVRFRIRAEKLLETRQGKNLLQGIEAFDYEAKGVKRNHIRSRKAEYDRDRHQAYFSDDVQIQMGMDIELKTDTLHYDQTSGIGFTDDLVRMNSPQAQGSAKGVRYDHQQHSLELRSNLDFTLQRSVTQAGQPPQTEHIHARSDHGYYSQSEQKMR